MLRAAAPSAAYPVPPARGALPGPGLLAGIVRRVRALFARVRAWLAGGVDWWRPLCVGSARDYREPRAPLRDTN